MRKLLALACVVAAAAVVAPAGSTPVAYRCQPTVDDGFGPFGRGEPPVRSRVGRGHVLTGFVRSAVDCRAIPGARVHLWQAGKGYRYTRAGSATVVTGRDGRFRFEGPVPFAPAGRSPHIHIRILAPAHRPLLARYEVPRGSRRGEITLTLEPEEL